MTDPRPFEDVEITPDGFSLPEEKWRELLFIGSLRPAGEAFVRDPGRPLPPFRLPGLFPSGARFFATPAGGRVCLRVERPLATPAAEQPFLAGPGLAPRLEAAEVAWASALAAAAVRYHPAAEVACEPRAGGVAVYLGALSPLTGVWGLGRGTPLTLADLEALEYFFRSRGCPARIAVSPFADPSLIGLAGAWGYVVESFENVLFRPLGTADRFYAETAGARVRPVEAGERDLWLRTLVAGAGSHPPDAAISTLAPVLLEVAAERALLARHRGEAAGVAALFVHDRVAWGFADATLPAFRRRGVHGALIEARLGLALSAGCDLAIAVAEPGGAVQRNHERAGYCLAFTRAILSRRGVLN